MNLDILLFCYLPILYSRELGICGHRANEKSDVTCRRFRVQTLYQVPQEINKWCKHTLTIQKNYNPTLYRHTKIPDGQIVIRLL